MDFTLSTELIELRETCRDFVQRELRPLEVEVEMAEGRLAPDKRKELEAKIKAMGLHASSLPRAIGGTELSWEAQVVLQEECGSVTNALGWLFWAPAIVLRHASPDQIERYVRPAALGTRVACSGVSATR